MVMQIEQEFAKKDLSVFKTEPIEAFARGICKYRLFNCASAFKYISHIGYSEESAKLIFNTLSRYLVTGVPPKSSISKKIFDAVEKYRYSHPALTPSEAERRRVVNQPKRKSKAKPVATVEPKEPVKITEQLPTSFGIKIGNTIKLMLNEDCCKAYLDAYREFDEETVLEVVKLKYKLLEE